MHCLAGPSTLCQMIRDLSCGQFDHETKCMSRKKGGAKGSPGKVLIPMATSSLATVASSGHPPTRSASHRHM